jgi:hypothetical protein
VTFVAYFTWVATKAPRLWSAPMASTGMVSFVFW